jgi:hypothetical protein
VSHHLPFFQLKNTLSSKNRIKTQDIGNITKKANWLATSTWFVGKSQKLIENGEHLLDCDIRIENQAGLVIPMPFGTHRDAQIYYLYHFPPPIVFPFVRISLPHSVRSLRL